MQSRALAASSPVLEQSPALLAREGQHDSPPPYPSSGNTTALPTPGPSVTPPLDPVQRRWLIYGEFAASFPSQQFKYQAKRLRERLDDQFLYSVRGRKQTIPFDFRSDFLANAENIVRESWLAQKIWRPSWGPAWAPGVDLSTNAMAPHGDGPRHVGGEWTSMRRSGKTASVKQEAQLKSIGDASEEAIDRRQHIEIMNWYFTSTNESDSDDDNTQLDHEASRPLPQFLSQLPQERQWIQDELEFTGEEPTLDLDTLAFQSLRKFWIDQGIWRSSWRVVPGDEWLHESIDYDTYERQREIEDGIVEPVPKNEPKTAQGNRDFTRTVDGSANFNTTASSEAVRDTGDTQVEREFEVFGNSDDHANADRLNIWSNIWGNHRDDPFVPAARSNGHAPPAMSERGSGEMWTRVGPQRKGSATTPKPQRRSERLKEKNSPAQAKGNHQSSTGHTEPKRKERRKQPATSTQGMRPKGLSKTSSTNPRRPRAVSTKRITSMLKDS